MKYRLEVSNHETQIQKQTVTNIYIAKPNNCRIREFNLERAIADLRLDIRINEHTHTHLHTNTPTHINFKLSLVNNILNDYIIFLSSYIFNLVQRLP